MKPIPYGRQHITDEDIQAVVETLQSDFLTQGPKVAEFEKAFADYIGADYAVAVANGTAALHLCALALRVTAGTRVITTPITFAASANCIKYAGGEVYFADIDPETALLDLQKVKNLIESKPAGYFSGLIPVDFAGYPVDLEALRALANEHNLWIIEDACHAPGGYFVDAEGQKQKCGNGQFADLAIFSFHPVKHIATGEGGMITTNRQDLYEKLLLLRTHGITKNPELMHENHGGWYYEMQELGYNYRMPDMLTALGISQLKRADWSLGQRTRIAKKYDESFAKHPQIKILNQAVYQNSGSAKEIFHAYHLYVILVEDRKGLYDFLRANQIYAQVHYIPVHTMPYYQSLGFKKGNFPIAEGYYEKCLSLPMFPSLQPAEQDFVIAKVLDFLAK